MKYSLVFFALVMSFILPHSVSAADPSGRFWSIQAVDTMKYSRDQARNMLHDKSFDEVINKQIKNIAATGATHVAIGTPYDDEFLPFLKRWVKSARSHKLKVWFRGNWSGWEGWFDYAPITRKQHMDKTRAFLLKNKTLFVNGDIFTACPECENGGPGDPRMNGDAAGHRAFIISEYQMTKALFRSFGKQIASNYNSMNGDVARLIMNKKTTAALDGIVAVDHYVRDPKKLAKDLQALAVSSGGKIVLAEFGAPIPDIHGEFTDDEQASWIEQTLKEVAKISQVVGLNYWVGTGGSTAIWEDVGTAKHAVSVLRTFYKPKIVQGVVRGPNNRPLARVRLLSAYGQAHSGTDGSFRLPYLAGERLTIRVVALGYVYQKVPIKAGQSRVNIVLVKERR